MARDGAVGVECRKLSGFGEGGSEARARKYFGGISDSVFADFRDDFCAENEDVFVDV